MIKTQNINNAINEGVDFLVKNQLQNGSFLSLSSPDANNFVSDREYHTTFATSLILSCLNNLEETAQVQRIKQKATGFLLSQKSKNWSFNYWVRGSEESKVIPYPDDLDDTCCALSALFQYNPKLINASAMAKIIMLLTATEEKEGGPYRTWLVPLDAGKTWKDVDLAVNSNVAYFLSLHGVSLPNLNSFIESAIDENNYTSPFYPPGYPVIYFISRFYRGDKIKKITDSLVSKSQGSRQWGNLINNALAISSLLNLGFPVEKLNKNILYLIEKRNDWRKPYVFSIDPTIKEKRYFCGSSAMTTAFCLETLQKYLTVSQNKPSTISETKIIEDQKTAPEKTNEAEKQTKIYNSIIESAKERCSGLNTDLKEQALAQTLKTSRDKRIVLLPYFFKIALAENGKNISDEKLKQLGLANLYGWTAYTIYDDFLDNEGEPKLLSVANLMLRELTTIFNNVLPPESGFHTFFHQTMDTLDTANTWEINNCRIDTKSNQLKIPNTLPDYGDYTKIAERSLGHTLGPIVILFSLGYTEKSPEVEKVMAFFKHYITARQLNDDAHDWEEDIKKGHINSVGAAVLKKWKKVMPPDKQNQTNILKIMPDLQKIFWYDVMPEICQNVLKHTELAEKSLKAVPLISNPSIMINILVSVRGAAQKALTEREEAIKFLKAYNKV